MAEVNPKAFRRPWITILVILFLILPSLFFALWYNYEPAKELDNGPRLICGGGGVVQIHRKTDVINVVPPNLLGYRPPVSLSNAMSAYFPDEEFSSEVRPTQMRWFGVVCPLSAEAADAFEAHYRSIAPNAEVPKWVTYRPLYSFDCSTDYPFGFDFTVMVKLPMYHMQQFRLEMWSGRDTPLSSIRHLTNLSVVDYTARRTVAGDVADPSFVLGQMGSATTDNSKKTEHSFSEQSRTGGSGPATATYTAASSIASTESIKACDKVTDECVQASMLTYTKSFKMIYPQTYGAGYNGRLLLQQPSSDNLWQISITSDLGKNPSKVDIALIVEPAKGTRAPFFRFIAGSIFLVLFILLFVVVKLIGLYTKRRDTTRLFSIIDPHHDEIIQEGWDDLRKLFQYWQFKFTETRSWWSAAARRRRYRRMMGPNADVSRGEEGNLSTNNNSSEDTISPTAALAARAKASMAAAATQPGGGYPSSSEEEGEVCRICRIAEPSSDLIAPCACSGTSKFIHRECLKQWRNMTTNPEHKRICAECKTEYNVEMEVPQRTIGQRIYAVCLPFLKLFAVLASFVALGYAIKVIARVVTLDPNIEWSVNFYHVFIGSLALCSIMIVFSNGLWYVVDYPKTLYHRLPALLVLGIVGPILLGYMAQLWSAIVFGTVITPEISFGAGVFTFISFVNNLLLKISEILTPPMESQRGRAPSITIEEDSLPSIVTTATANPEREDPTRAVASDREGTSEENVAEPTVPEVPHASIVSASPANDEGSAASSSTSSTSPVSSSSEPPVEMTPVSPAHATA